MSAVWSNELMTMQKYIADQNRHKHVWVSELLTALQAVIEMQLLIVFLHIETDIFEACLNIQISNPARKYHIAASESWLQVKRDRRIPDLVRASCFHA